MIDRENGFLCVDDRSQCFGVDIVSATSVSLLLCEQPRVGQRWRGDG